MQTQTQEIMAGKVVWYENLPREAKADEALAPGEFSYRFTKDGPQGKVYVASGTPSTRGNIQVLAIH